MTPGMMYRAAPLVDSGSVRVRFRVLVPVLVRNPVPVRRLFNLFGVRVRIPSFFNLFPVPFSGRKVMTPGMMYRWAPR